MDELIQIEKIKIEERRNKEGILKSIVYRITEQENYSVEEHYDEDGNLQLLEIRFVPYGKATGGYFEVIHIKDGKEIVLDKPYNTEWRGELVNTELKNFQKNVRREYNLDDSEPLELFNGPFYFEITEQNWLGKNESYYWCQIFKFRSKYEFNEKTDDGMYDHDESSCGEFYYDDSSKSYVDWSVIKKDLNSEGFLDIGNSIGNDEFEGTNDELLNYLRNKHGDETKIDLISNMEPV